MDQESGLPPATGLDTAIRFDLSYIISAAGILKVIQLLLNIIGFVFVSVETHSETHSVNNFGFVSLFGFGITLILLLLYLFHITERIYCVPWLVTEMIYCGIWTFLYFSTATALSRITHTEGDFFKAAVSGYIAMLAYAFDMYVKVISCALGGDNEDSP